MITSKWLMFLRGFHGFIDRSRDFAGSKVQLVQNAREALRYKTLVLYDQDTRMVLLHRHSLCSECSEKRTRSLENDPAQNWLSHTTKESGSCIIKCNAAANCRHRP